MSIKSLQVARDNIRSSRLITLDSLDLHAGQVRVAIDRFALTANNVTYAVAGDTIGYWHFYPGDERWGHVPCWGLGNVVESSHPDLVVGERLYGFFPMASETVLTLDRVKPGQATEVSPHRCDLPATYNHYSRTAVEPATLQAMENERCIFFPLFATSYLLYDFLLDNAMFGAEAVLVGSASSKTAFGMAKLLQDSSEVSARIVGITSSGNASFTQSLGAYDQVVTYGNEDVLDAAESVAYVDMSGDARLTSALHQHFGESLRLSLAVGATHWESFGAATESLPGPKPEFFFAPAQIQKRDTEWGKGEVMRRATEAMMSLVDGVARGISIQRIDDAERVRLVWSALVENRQPASEAVIASL
ncbi:MAG: DUF2855 family protein [Pseudomonadota bacterium]